MYAAPRRAIDKGGEGTKTNFVIYMMEKLDFWSDQAYLLTAIKRPVFILHLLVVDVRCKFNSTKYLKEIMLKKNVMRMS